MTRTEYDIVDQLIRVAEKHYHHITISQDDFKKIVQKDRLRMVYVEKIAENLRAKGYILIDLREKKGCISITWIELFMRFVQPDIKEFVFSENN